MKKLFIILAILSLPLTTYSQSVTGKLVDQSGKGIAGLQLRLHMSSKTYNTSSLTDGTFNFSNVSSIEEPELPSNYFISDNYPNPFNPKTRIVFSFPNYTRVNINVYNLLGQRMLQEINKYVNAGVSYQDLELNGLPNGIYFARIIVDEKYAVTRKLMLMYGSQHLSSSTPTIEIRDDVKSRLNKSSFDVKIDSLVVTNTSFGKKVFKGLPSMTTSFHNLGVLTLVQDKIETSTAIEVANQIVSTTGGIIKIARPGTPLDGMEIIIPTNSISSNKSMKISYAEVKRHSLGQNFNPLSPLISISSDIGYSSDNMTIKIPVKLPAGHFAMCFIYDDKTGKIEGMPLIGVENNFVTISTRNLSPYRAGLFKSNNVVDGTSTTNMIVSSINESVLNSQLVISSGYKPGIDDWEFPNFGSYIEPGGHCAGQSIGSMWYYYEKKLRGNGNLFHKYDKLFQANNSADYFWIDNSRGYRFSSAIQKAINWDGYLYNLFYKTASTPNYHTLSWKAFALSMLLTGEPQFVGLFSNSGGHAIIAHKISLTEKKLYVTDPNFPGQERVITFDGSKFIPYSTKQNASEVDAKAYTGIGYFSKTSMIDWELIGSLWKKFEENTIGNDDFPKYKLYYQVNGKYEELKDSITVNEEILALAYDSQTKDMGFFAYDENGNEFVNEIKLTQGTHFYGFNIVAIPEGSKNAEWVDFRWIKVTYIPKINIDCPSSVSHGGKSYKTIAIGNQCWLKENLNIGTITAGDKNLTDNGIIEKHCYNNELNNCEKYGGLYTWGEAVQYKNGADAGRSPNPAFSGNVQGICPIGWHIPQLSEYQILIAAVSKIGNSLKDLGQGTGQGGSGTNVSGFSALLAGRKQGLQSVYYDLGLYSYIWSATESDRFDAQAMGLYFLDNQIYLYSHSKYYGYSVRCLKD